MKRTWISLALFSASWLFGLSYYHDAQWLIWSVFIAAGTGLLIGVQLRKSTAFEVAIAAIMLLPVIKLAPWPYRIAPLLIFAGLLLVTIPIPRRWPQYLSPAFILAGSILMIQSIGIFGYIYITSRSHELPKFISYMLSGITRIIGIPSAFNGLNLALYTQRLVHPLGATWEMFFDPATFVFLFGGIIILCLCKSNGISRKKQIAILVISIILWLPIRAAIIISIFMHRALETGYESELVLVTQFWNRWLLLLLLVGPVLIAWRFVNRPFHTHHASVIQPEISRYKNIGIVTMIFMGSFLLISGILLDLPGSRKKERVMVDEFHSTWERTDRPFDTEWYGQDSGYNYACIYDYCSRFYNMSRLMTAIDKTTLDDCDVLIIKVPTSRYAPEEISIIEEFVKQGGGLMLMGEHTSVFDSGTYINDIAKVFGFRFRYDCLFDMDTTFEQLYNPPLVPHPIIQNMPPLNFAVSCSIEPMTRIGRAAIRSTGLKQLTADYHVSNYYPQVENLAQMRYGAFIQSWTTHYGQGRVAAFSDSTIFSNFATFEPGKAELMLGMIEWLNYNNLRFNVTALLLISGSIIFAFGIILSRKLNSVWLMIATSTLLGWAAASAGAKTIHKHSMPEPQAKRPMINVTIDRTVCDSPLSRSGFISGQKNGFGIFERWILRLGYFTSRKEGIKAISDDLVVFMYPNLTVSNEFRDTLVDYVTKGGNILILDSPQNTGSKANSLLYPFGININRTTAQSGQLKAPDNWPTTTIDSAYPIEGAEPFMWINNIPIGASLDFGNGTVTVISFASKFVDASMGITGDVTPNIEQRKVFELEFNILKRIISGREIQGN
ncbi:MAG: hypothetical protein JXA96_07690 [Sedimentisphaerales bacterium]|nr:hypothetical protein [Sedimentisphaerales bacterium]